MKFRATLYFTLISVFSPVASLLLGLRRSNIEIKRWALIVFITFYGSVIFLSEANDGYWHERRVVTDYMDMGFTGFFSGIYSILKFEQAEGIKGDLYIHFLSFLIGSILKVPGLFFVAVAFIYGYFYSSSVFLIYRLLDFSKKSKLLWLLFIIFVLWKNLEGINTVRTWTGLWVLFYGVSHYAVYRKKRFLLFALLPPAIHVGYFLMAVPAWLVLFFNKFLPQKVMFGLFVVSFLFTFNSNEAREYMQTTELGTQKTTYINDEQNKHRQEAVEESSLRLQSQGPWYNRLAKEGFHSYGFLVLVIGVHLLNITNFSGRELLLLNVGMMTIALANYFNFITAVYNRASIIGEVFVLAFLVIMYSKSLTYNDLRVKRRLNLLVYFSLTFLMAFVIYKFADMIYFLSVYLLAFPFIVWLENSMNISIREALGALFQK